MILLDTCVLSELARARPDPGVMAWFEGQAEESVFLSVLTLGEIQKGAALLDPGERRDRIERWLAGLLRTFGERILPVDTEVALRWGEGQAAGQRIGRVPPPVDALIAATAQKHGLAVATRNVGDFEGTGVAVVNPWGRRLV